MDKAMIGEMEMDNKRQEENEKLLKQIEDAEDVISEIYYNSNPSYLIQRKVQYFKEYTNE